MILKVRTQLIKIWNTGEGTGLVTHVSLVLEMPSLRSQVDIYMEIHAKPYVSKWTSSLKKAAGPEL